MKQIKLQEFRKKQGLTQEQMAQELNITVAHYKAIEYGVRRPSFNLLERIKLRFPKFSVDKIFLSQ